MTNVTAIKPATDTFDEFWRLYPKKVGKAVARALWDQITGSGLTTRTLVKDSGTYITIELKATPAEIIAGAKIYRESQMDRGVGKFGLKDDGKYTAHPSTWLNQARWMDGA